MARPFSMMASDGEPQRGAAEHGAARRISAAAERHLVGVALQIADRFKRHAEPFAHQLCERRRMALSMRMGAGNDRHRAAGIEADAHASR